MSSLWRRDMYYVTDKAKWSFDWDAHYITAGLRDDFEASLRIIEEIYLNELMNTADAQEGLKAFLEKRTPQWKNE